MAATQDLSSLQISALDAPLDPRVHNLDSWVQARQASVLSGRPTLVICGANWCGDARMLATMIAHDKIAQELSNRFEIALVDVGDYDRAQGVHAHYGYEVLEGLPAVFVVSPTGELLNKDSVFSWRNARERHVGELADWLFPMAQPRATTVLPYLEVHAFPDGDRAFSGNPAGVCLLEQDLDDATLLGVAQNNNLSETAYVQALGDEDDLWSLRWFTPGLEVDLCGHATLGAAAALFYKGQVKGETAHFDTKSGRLEVTHRPGQGFEMNFPVVTFEAAEARPGVVAAMGAGDPEAVFEVEPIHGGPYQMFVYRDEATIRGLNIDHGALQNTGVNVVATAPGEGTDFVSRFFAPAVGLIEEDPVTGSAHCTLVPYWAQRLGKEEMSAKQIGPRPGALVVNTQTTGRVKLRGEAKIYLDGQIVI